MKAVVLGSGQDGGVPQLFGPDRPHRTAASLAIVTDAGTVLIDCGPDVRSQHRALTSLVGTDRARIAAVALTHGHMGHYTGILHFGKEAAATSGIPVHASNSMLRFLSENEPWASVFRDGYLVAGSDRFEIGGVHCEAIPVPHRSEFTDAVAWSVSSSGFSLLYLPDIDSWDEWPEAAETVDRHDVALLDGTFFDENEPIERSLADVPHPLVVDTVDRFAGTSCRIILTHLNHTNALARNDSSAHALVRGAGFEVAEDGMVIG